MTQYPMPVFPPTYLIDTSVFRTLHGCHGGCPPENPDGPFDEDQQEEVLAVLARIAKDGRVRIINQVFGELERRCPTSFQRAKSLPNHRTVPRNEPLVRVYQEITGTHDRMVRRMNANPADPWIVAWGRLMMAQRAVVVTEEIPLAAAKNKLSRKRKLHFGLPLPDLCDEYELPWINLSGLLADEESPQLLG